MKILVVFDSFFGNTEKIAQAIGKGIGSMQESTVVKVSEASKLNLSEFALLIVGSPTRAFRPSPSIKIFLQNIPVDGLKGVKVTAFDTRASLEQIKSKILNFMVKIFGYADKPILKSLVRKGGEQVVSSEGFIVNGTEGPLKEGELERSADWARRIVSIIHK